MNPPCDRCTKVTNTTKMSMFNKDVLCLDCIDIEKKHPDYKKACDADHEQIKKKNYNFSGIGKPSDL